MLGTNEFLGPLLLIWINIILSMTCSNDMCPVHCGMKAVQSSKVHTLRMSHTPVSEWHRNIMVSSRSQLLNAIKWCTHDNLKGKGTDLIVLKFDIHIVSDSAPSWTAFWCHGSQIEVTVSEKVMILLIFFNISLTTPLKLDHETRNGEAICWIVREKFRFCWNSEMSYRLERFRYM